MSDERPDRPAAESMQGPAEAAGSSPYEMAPTQADELLARSIELGEEPGRGLSLEEPNG